MTQFKDSKVFASIEPFDFEIYYGSRNEPGRCRVTEIDFQRNGVSGESFYVCRFMSSESPERPLIGIVFDDRKYVAVIDPENLTQHWRGDYYEDGLRAAIEANQDVIWKNWDIEDRDAVA